MKFRRDLAILAGVVAVPVQVFVDTSAAWRYLVRFAFCKRDDVLDEAIARLTSVGQ